jgi:UDP-N-acetylglucosamine 2-epimerase (non-hydrolysing)
VGRPQLKILHEDELEPKACVVVGTRPGIIMFGPIVRELTRQGVPHFILHTGQHYSYNMDRQLFEELELPEPDYTLDTVKLATLHGAQTAEMLRGCEEVFLSERPRLVLVSGDANTNLAGALAARKLHIQVGHVEAGERSYDWRMPEEHNRVLIDHLSDYLFATSEKGAENLRADSCRGKIVVTGNPIVDACREHLELAKSRSDVLERVGVEPGGYVAATVHREENTDSAAALAGIMEGMARVAEDLGRAVVFAVHPRTRKRLGEHGIEAERPGVRLVDAVGYLDFLNLAARASLVLTDSGGVQQESCILGVPCVTLRESTEWTETLELGANRLAGADPERIAAAAREMSGASGTWEQPFGDGHAAVRIVHAAAEAVSANAEVAAAG